MEKDVQAKYRELGPTKTPSENAHISDKTIHGHKCIGYSQLSNQMLLVNEFACIFYRTNLLKIVDTVFEVDKFHSWSDTLTHRVGANTLSLEMDPTKYPFWP